MLKRVPHTFVIVFFLIMFSAILTWVIPGGEFAREKIMVNGVEREVIKSHTFQYTVNEKQTWQVFSAFYEGFVHTAPIIVFILIIGGAFWIMNESRSIDFGIREFLKKTRKWESSAFLRRIGVNRFILIIIMGIFSLFGAVFGMSEETIAFTIIFVPLAISMGYDSIVGVSMCFVAAALGFAGAFLNPFTVGIAQGLSEIPLFSGIGYRLVMWVIINLAGFTYILRYASSIHRNPEKSSVFYDDEYWRKRHREDNQVIHSHVPLQAWITFFLLSVSLVLFSVYYPVTQLQAGNNHVNLPAVPAMSALFILTGFFALRKTVHYFILGLLGFTVIFLIIGVMGYQWYIMEIAALFLALGICSGLALAKTPNQLTRSFLDGAADILPAAMVVGLAGGIVVVLENGKIIDTILYYFSLSMNDLGKMGSVSVMYMIQTLLNIFIPSGSGKAALTMPMMSQFSDLIGISRQATVVAFQLGDGFTNMITPTSGVLIGVLGVARIPYQKWFKWVWPLMLILTLLGFLLLIPTVMFKLDGF